MPTRASALALTATPAPTPGPDPSSISPGLTGFLATFALVVVCLFLFVSMVRRLRRMQYRSERDALAERDAEVERDPGADQPDEKS